MQGNIVFDAKIGEWLCVKKEKIDGKAGDMDVARVLASIHDAMNDKIWHFVGRELDGKRLDAIAYGIVRENGGKSPEEIARSLSKISSPSTTKKIGVKGKKAMEIAKTYVARRVIDGLGLGIEFPMEQTGIGRAEKAKGGKAAEAKITGLEGRILFDAEVGNWVCIKKQAMNTDTENMDIARILASIHDSMHRKIWEFAGKEIDLESVDRIAYGITGAKYNQKKKRWELKGRKSEAQILENLVKLNSDGTLKQINAIEKDAKKAGIAKDYLTRRVLDLLGFRLELDPKLAESYIDEKAKIG